MEQEIEIEKIPHPAESLEQAQEWGKRLADWLNEKTGVEWSVRAHENMGFFYSAQHGTISVSQSQYNHDLGRFLVMNAGTHWVGVGHVAMRSYLATDGPDLLASIELCIRDIESELQAWNEALFKNQDISRKPEVVRPEKKKKE